MASFHPAFDYLTAEPSPISVEAPSGKDRKAENFPVGVLIAPGLRPHVHAFYDFARNADDIADSATLSAAEKIARLGVMEDVLLGRRDAGSPTATALRTSLAQTGVTPEHARDLLHAFRHDAMTSRTASWAALMEYCQYSAMPVGRYVLDLHGAPDACRGPSDALCSVLQVLNHVQDCARDLAEMDRCYLPLDMLEAAGARVEDLRGARETPALRVVFSTLLDRCDELNRAAAPLPARTSGVRLRLECAVIVELAKHLTARLRAGDPIAARVKLTRMDVVGSVARAVTRLF
jgi:farnesyl-diphosphate farnesyltransferase